MLLFPPAPRWGVYSQDGSYSRLALLMMKKPHSQKQFDLSLDDIDLLWSIAKHSSVKLTAPPETVRRLEEMDLITSLVDGKAALTQSGRALLDGFVADHSIDTGASRSRK